MSELIVRAGAMDVALIRRALTPMLLPAPVPHRVVVDAPVATRTDLAAVVGAAGLPFLVDPQTYLWQEAVHPDRAWTRLPFARPDAHSPGDLLTPSIRDPLIDACIDFQLAAGASVILAPYVHLDSADDPWVDVQAGLWRRTRQRLRDRGLATGVIAVLAVGPRLLHPTHGFTSLRGPLRALGELAPLEVAVAASRAHLGARCATQVGDLGTLIRRLQQVWPVLAWQQGLLGEACVALGARGYETGLGWRETCDLRKSMASARTSPGPGARPGARPVYVDQLMRSIPKASVRALRRHRSVWAELACPDPLCCRPDGAGLLTDARQHALNRRLTALAELDAIAEPRWRWTHVANRSSVALKVAGRINRLAAKKPGIRQIDTTAAAAVQAVATHLRAQRSLRRPA